MTRARRSGQEGLANPVTHEFPPYAGMTAPLPWSITTLWKVGSANLLGYACIVAAYFGVSATSNWERQRLWTVMVGAFGLLLLLVANSSWFLFSRRAVGVRRRALLRSVAEALAGTEFQLADSKRPLVTRGGMRHYHQETCQTVVGKLVAAASQGEHELAGLKPCGMCKP